LNGHILWSGEKNQLSIMKCNWLVLDDDSRLFQALHFAVEVFYAERQMVVAGAMQVGGVGIFNNGRVHIMKQLDFEARVGALQHQGDVSSFDSFYPHVGG